jgi:hypothetical protein
MNIEAFERPSMIGSRLVHLIALFPVLPLIVLFIPKAIVLMPEPGEYIPWYTKYTALPWLLTAFYVSPTTTLTQLLGFAVFGSVHIALMLVYAGGISLVLHRVMVMIVFDE